MASSVMQLLSHIDSDAFVDSDHEAIRLRRSVVVSICFDSFRYLDPTVNEVTRLQLHLVVLRRALE
jgi:hypothetical protein